MNPLTTLQLATITTADRLSAAGRRTRATARRLALTTPATVEPADLLVAVSGRRVRVPRWWTAFEAGETVASRRAAVAVAAHTDQTEDCVAC